MLTIKPETPEAIASYILWLVRMSEKPEQETLKKIYNYECPLSGEGSPLKNYIER